MRQYFILQLHQQALLTIEFPSKFLETLSAHYHDLVSLNHLNTVKHMLASLLTPQVVPNLLT